jgi:hypothetical protein
LCPGDVRTLAPKTAGLNCGYGHPLSKEDAITLIRDAAECGVTFFDMQPKPTAETFKLLFPSLRFCMLFSSIGVSSAAQRRPLHRFGSI